MTDINKGRGIRDDNRYLGLGRVGIELKTLISGARRYAKHLKDSHVQFAGYLRLAMIGS